MIVRELRIKMIEKLFCTHSWKSHAKNIYRFDYLNNNKYEQTTEILICEKCGKIKQINY